MQGILAPLSLAQGTLTAAIHYKAIDCLSGDRGHAQRQPTKEEGRINVKVIEPPCRNKPTDIIAKLCYSRQIALGSVGFVATPLSC